MVELCTWVIPKLQASRSIAVRGWGLGYLPQQSSIFRGLSVERNLLAALELSIADPTERHERLDSLLGEFGISHLRGTPAVSLSGGERRSRLEIARALASEPSFFAL